MRHVARFAMLGALVSIALFATALAPAAQASFNVTKWEAGTCKVSTCADAGSTSDFYTQAAGHPDFGITDFEFSFKEAGLTKAKEPESNVKDVRVDLPPGLAVNPEATKAQCAQSQLEKFECPSDSEVGEDQATGTAELVLGLKTTVEEKFHVYNMERKPEQPARFGVSINSKTLEVAEGVTGHKLRGELYLEGGISWHQEAETSESSGVPTGDYHEYFKIPNIPTQPEIVESRLIFWGVPQEHQESPTEPPTAFLTLPSTCSSKPITRLHLDSYEDPGHFLAYTNETPVAATGCDTLPFGPSLSLVPATTQSDQPDGGEVTLHIPQSTNEPSKANSPDLQTAQVALPEGMTINPSAAHGLESCTNAEVALGTDNPIGCPAASQIGTVSVEAPGIPAGSLTGSIYVAQQESQEPESGKQFRIFLVAEASQYGVGVRLEGQIRANKQTGRLTATVANNPQVPFEDFKLKFNGGARAPIANPLTCGTAQVEAALTPYTGEAAALSSSPFTTSGCPNPLPFALTQSTKSSNATAGAYSPYTFNLTRADGQQYLSQISTTLPAGLLGAIPSVALCGEPQAAQGTCTAGSQIGTATVTAGAGSEPYPLSGPVYLTGPYNGAPYGLSIPVAVVAGPFNLGTVVTRAMITVDPYSARVSATTPPQGTPGALPTIVGGVPVRLKTLSVAVSRSNFIFNPTNCGPLHTESTLTSVFNAKQPLSTPFQVANCTALPFKPSFKTSTSAKTSKLNGASLQVNLTQGAHEANMKSVVVSLPKQLPSRLTTLQKACPEATFAANPVNCRALGSEVGTATVATPVLPDTPSGRVANLTGSAYLVSHGGAAFPDLDLVLEGDGGVRVILTGNTNIKGGITTSTFASIPDVPVSSFVLNLPVGPHSALTAIGGLCLKPLLIPTTITAQSGAQVKQNTRISVSGCSVRILSHRVVKHKLIIKVRTLGAGLIKLKGTGLPTVSRRVNKSATVTFKLPLTHGGQKALSRAHRRHRKLKVSVHVAFTPKQKGQFGSAASAAVMFK
jgi:hypothetical protein